jgi:phosphonate transport system substrate-binding protein
MISKRHFMAGASAVATANFATRLATAQQPALVFTGIPSEDETRLIERFGGYAKYFEAKLGVPVKYLPVKSYPAAVTAFTNNQVQFAWFGGLTGVQARLSVPGSVALAQGAEDVAFTSYFIANAATGFKRGAEFPKLIEGKSFTFGSRGSTSGRLMPEYHIRQTLGKAPEVAFPRVGFSGDHSRTIQLVQSGAYEIGALDHLVWEAEVKAGKVDEKLVSVIWETPPFPDYHFVARGDIDTTFGAGFSEKLKATILGIDDPKLLAIFDRSKFIPTSSDNYKVIEDVGKLVGLIN